jgi:hypothetical protein
MQAEGGTFKGITVSGKSTLTEVIIKGSIRSDVSILNPGNYNANAYGDCYYAQGGSSGIQLPDEANQVGRLISAYAPYGCTFTVTCQNGKGIHTPIGNVTSFIVSGGIATFRCISQGYWVVQSFLRDHVNGGIGYNLDLLGFARVTKSGGVTTSSISRNSTEAFSVQKGSGGGSYSIYFPSSWGTPMIMVQAEDSSFSACSASVSNISNGHCLVRTAFGTSSVDCGFSIAFLGTKAFQQAIDHGVIS